VFAFEQSLVNMTQRLQRLAATTDQKASSLRDIVLLLHFIPSQIYSPFYREQTVTLLEWSPKFLIVSLSVTVSRADLANLRCL